MPIEIDYPVDDVIGDNPSNLPPIYAKAGVVITVHRQTEIIVENIYSILIIVVLIILSAKVCPLVSHKGQRNPMKHGTKSTQ